MAKTYVTFGQSHIHSVNGKTFDKDTVAVIECTSEADGREKAFEFFGPKFCMEYHEDWWKKNSEDITRWTPTLVEVN